MTTLRRDLRQGMSNKGVTELQNLLGQLGYKSEDRAGYFGKATTQALADFQADNGLLATGEFNEETASELEAAARSGYTVSGTVTFADGTPATGITVRAFDLDLRGKETELGREKTDSTGKYTIEYTPNDLSREGKPTADLLMRLYETAGIIDAEQGPFYDAPEDLTVDFVMRGIPLRGPSLYDQVETAIEPFLGTVEAAELDARDCEYLANKTGLPQRAIAGYAEAARGDLPQMVFFALANAAMPTDPVGVVQADEALLVRALEQAQAANLIAELDSAQAIDELRDEALAQIVNTPQFIADDDLLRTVLRAAQVEQEVKIEFTQAYLTGDDLWADLKPEDEAELRFVMAAAEVTYNSQEMIYLLREDESIDDWADIAALDIDEWAELLENASNPPEIPGDTADEKAAAVLLRVEDGLPLARCAFRLGEAGIPGDEENDDLAETLSRFFDANPDIDLATADADAVLDADTALDATEKTRMREALHNIQRVYRLTHHERELRALVENGWANALTIVRAGRQAFRDATLFLAEGRADAIYDRADAIHTAVMLRHQHPTLNPAAVSMRGPEDPCAPDDCDTVFGPVAYLDDAFDWLGEQIIEDDGRNLRDALFERRPDLAQIEATCATVNEAVSLHDIAAEVLDAAVPGAFRVYPWQHPYDPALTFMRKGMIQLGTQRWRLMQAFSAMPNADLAVAAEMLGLSGVERDIVIGEPVLKSALDAEYWSLAEMWGFLPDETEWARALAPVPAMLRRSGLSYEELVATLALRYVNPDGKVAITGAPCEIDDMGLRFIDTPFLDRLHRFVRLWRATGYDAFSLDRVIIALAPRDESGDPLLNNDFLLALSHVERLRLAFEIPVETILGWYRPLDTHAYAPGDGRVMPSVFRQRFPNVHDGSLLDQLDALAVALNTPRDLTRQLVLRVPPGENDARPASVENLSLMYRLLSLSRAMHLSLDELYAHIELAGVSPFAGGPSATLQFYNEVVDVIANSGFTVEETQQLLQGGAAGVLVSESEATRTMVAARTTTNLDGLRLALTESLQIAPGFVDELSIYAEDVMSALTSTNTYGQFQAAILLHKVAAVIKRWQPSRLEFTYLLEAGLLGLLGDKSDSAAWLSLAEAFAHPISRLLITDIPADVSQADFTSQVHQLTGWEPADLVVVVDMLGFTAADDVTLLRRLGRAFEWLSALNTSATNVRAWVQPELIDEDALINFALLLGDALPTVEATVTAGRVAAQSAALQARWNFESTAELSAQLLIDVEADYPTTRAAHAIDVVTRFVDRWASGLEPGDVRWMGDLPAYTDWATARQAFYYPENDLLPEKSPFFEALEIELAQGEVTQAAAETAFRGYLKKLAGVARLQIAGMYQDGASLVVVGRTPTAPHTHYIRRWENHRWSPWQRIDADIQGDHVIPVVYDGRVRVYWPVFNEVVTGPFNATETHLMHVGSKLLALNLELSRAVVSAGEEVTEAVVSINRTLKEMATAVAGAFEFEDLAASLDDLAIMTESTITHDPAEINKRIKDLQAEIDRLLGHRQGDIDILPRKQVEIRMAVTELHNGRWTPPKHAPEAIRFADTTGNSLDKPRLFNFSGEVFDDVLRISAFINKLTTGVINNRPVAHGEIVPIGHFRINTCAATIAAETAILDATDLFADITRAISADENPYAVRLMNGHPVSLHDDPNSALHGRVREVFDPATNYRLVAAHTAADVVSVMAQPFFYADANNVVFINGEGGILFDHEGACDLLNALDHEGIGGVLRGHVQEDLEFEHTAPNGVYNWEVFYHIPLSIAAKLTAEGHYADAERWLRGVLDTTQRSNGAASPTRYWLLPALQIASAPQSAELDTWRHSPFDANKHPNRSALQKAALMHYLDLLLAWSDQLTLGGHSAAAARKLLLAAQLLGHKPVQRTVTERNVDGALIEAENTMPMGHGGGNVWRSLSRAVNRALPLNPRLTAYWDAVEVRVNRLHAAGRTAPPRDLVLATTSALRAPSTLPETQAIAAPNVALLPYRFRVLVGHAKELAQEVKALGAVLRDALQRRDTEMLLGLHTGHATDLRETLQLAREAEVEAAENDLRALHRASEMAEARRAYHAEISAMRPPQQLALAVQANRVRGQASGTNGPAALPEVALGLGSAFGPSRRVAQAFDDVQANQEKAYFDTQIRAAEGRLATALAELSAHKAQLEQSQQVSAAMSARFTSYELYHWLVAQVMGLYFQAYQLAHDIASRAELAYQFELAAPAQFLQIGAWEGTRKGLLAGERLLHSIQRMETAYRSAHQREFEITRHVALSVVDPIALVRFRATGDCFVQLPDVLFDLDHPGHYLRRLKSVSVTIPCIAGPYTSISARLTLLENAVRMSPTPGDDALQTYATGTQSIVTSTARDDSGQFVLDFGDDRYLPFEGAGAESHWRLTLPGQFRQFDYETIADVVLTLRYTARDGGSGYRTVVESNLHTELNTMLESQAGLPRLFSLRENFPTAWETFRANSTAEIAITREQLPFMVYDRSVLINSVTVIATANNDDAGRIRLIRPGGTEERTQPLVFDADLGVHTATWTFRDASLGTWEIIRNGLLDLDDLLILFTYTLV